MKEQGTKQRKRIVMFFDPFRMRRLIFQIQTFEKFLDQVDSLEEGACFGFAEPVSYGKHGDYEWVLDFRLTKNGDGNANGRVEIKDDVDE